MSVSAAQLTFWAYAALVGVIFASLGLIYTTGSIAQVFFITAGTFGAVSLYGYTTKRDLSGFGSFLFMGLIGHHHCFAGQPVFPERHVQPDHFGHWRARVHGPYGLGHPEDQGNVCTRPMM